MRSPAPPQQRIRMLLEVVDDEAELTHTTEAFGERGWPVRAAEPAERPASPAPRRTYLVAEVRLQGARVRAVRHAVDDVSRMVKRAGLGVWVRDAQLIRAPREVLVAYHVHRTNSRDGDGLRARALRWWRDRGGADTGRIVRTVPGTGPEEVLADLSGRRFGPEPFDAAAHGVRVPSYADPRPPEHDESPEERRVRWLWLGAAGAGVLVAWICGMALHWVSGWWRLLPALLAFAGALPMGRTAKETRDRSLPVQLALGAGFSLGIGALGAIMEGRSQGGPGMWLGGLALTGIILFTGFGVWMALRGTFVVRHSAWIVPLGIPVAWAMYAWLGDFMHAIYLDEFGIPEGTVPLEGFWRYPVATLPMGLALASALIFTAAAGWLRHFHVARGENRMYAVSVTVLLALTYVLTSVIIGAERAASAAGQAADAAQDGRQPDGYYGIQGTLLCVTPVRKDPVPVERGPIPRDHAVLSFGSSGDWIWLWDPERVRDLDDRSEAGIPDHPPAVFAVRRGDVRLEEAKPSADAQSPAPCPPATGAEKTTS
ncbi:DUF1109 domain-containing protein [Streptomyces sp. A7024]|uniref:DUF1109 domain-containing protein n=1 Tax=Streptomyces coryli TaxID=1128680 RepID=A0A6G4U8T3_9ACTN|nr:DUF1109 domain-containing protein [Streptomyces coryli]NGN67798.1 DUF1109 domain-containing protein [Streptomyces coryli]